MNRSELVMLSILYLRCPPAQDATGCASAGQKAFNSLFEMPLKPRSEHGIEITDLSILYLRCASGGISLSLLTVSLSILYLRCRNNHTATPHLLDCRAFNSLFEMPARSMHVPCRLTPTFQFSI